MTCSTSTSYPPVLVRAEQAEQLPSIGHTLLADSAATLGVLSSHRVSLGAGAAGAVPHRHTHSSELFYIIDGALDVLLGLQDTFDNHFVDSAIWEQR
jgi:quercetin dioxygenase-like cupin family protein